MKFIMFKLSVIFIILICLYIIRSQCNTLAEDNVESPELLKRLKRYTPHRKIPNCGMQKHDGTCIPKSKYLDKSTKQNLVATSHQGSKVVNGEKTLWGKLKSWIGLE
ncbi:uncharacterized protein LOC142228076 isoform X1 [Haematobia irritans]|uniref:uncharacterized protein LOC142228076 isoform X1 n=1 Tax=Haematobia irritans TaxID=7368 RepID=UPI003F4F4CA3